MEKHETTTSVENPRPWQSYHTVYTNAKAGMEGVDKERVQRIVYEMSKGSKYFENEEKKEAYMRQKIENMRSKCAKLTATDISHYQMVSDKRILELETTRDLSRIWLHVDMDAFYAAVETLSNPSLKGKPMAVGSMSMISTANYEARKFGVRAAMPGFIARKLCPELIFAPTDFKKYIHYSDLTRKVFQKYDPHYIAGSLDEAYLDITDVCNQRGITGGEIAEELRSSVHEETGLTCSAGVAPNRLLAKVCSDINKPNGQFVLPNDRSAVMTFISSLPIRKIGGIGKVTELILRDVFGINTCEEMLQKGGFLCALFSRSSADFFLSVGLGLGGTNTPEVRFRKSISSERTFSATDDEALLYQKLAEIAEMLCSDMQKEGLCGRTLTLKLKTASFEVRNRAVTLQTYICSSEDILKHASKLLKAELPVSIRLIGLRVSHFNIDKAAGASFDPKQKTLASFLVSGGDASRKSTADISSLGSDCSEPPFMGNMETAFSGHEIDHCEIRHPLDSINIQDMDPQHCSSSNNIVAGEVHEPLSIDIEENVNSADAVGTGSNQESCQAEVSGLKNAEFSLPRQPDGRNLDIVNRVVRENEASSSSERKSNLFWVHDYKCSLCGIEMPPDFVEERQEHSDFHLAEKLQEEESSTNFRNPMQKQRFVRDGSSSRQKSGRKKLKQSPKDGSHLSIDTFFVKSNQNF
ncbi:DNA polymerase kappa [Euphorbia lathyris]|uniref:DNA polymerase kappa n=1 Tax=Euphorbia lathyris TaxID=212925 RepID=UPI003313A664